MTDRGPKTQLARQLVELWEQHYGGVDFPGGTLDDMADAAVAHCLAHIRVSVVTGATVNQVWPEEEK
jgi:hypothetical protein